jgi:hypothetical protein
MGSRNGGRPVILSARCGFKPTRWQDQTLATMYWLVFAQSQIEPRTEARVDWRLGMRTVGSDQGLSHGELNVHEPIETSTSDLWPSLVRAAVAGAHHR